MRKSIAILAIFAIVIISSCSKKYSSTSDLAMTDPTMGPTVINANVSGQAAYTFPLGNSGTANIIKQAAHFKVSEATIDGNGSMIYTYTPADKYSGTDEVAITYSSTAEGSGSGCSGGTSGSGSTQASYLIKFNVNN